jgi:hypothetical protein
MLNDPLALVQHLQTFMNILTEWCTFKVEGARALKSHDEF